MQNSEAKRMNLIFDILDEVIDAIKPFAVIYSDLICKKGYSDLPIKDLARVLADSCKQGYLDCWIFDKEAGYQKEKEIYLGELEKAYELYLGKIEVCNITFDEIGYFFGMTKKGKKKWKQFSESDFMADEKESWVINENAYDRYVEIFANSNLLLKKALESWKKYNSNKTIIEKSKYEEENVFYKPKYYEEEILGCKLKFKYEINLDH